METLAHPGGNVTGLSLDASGLGGKRLEILKETFPKLTRTAVLYIRASPSSETILAETKQAARLLKVDLLPVAVDAVSELDRAFNMMSKEHAEAVLKIPSGLLTAFRKQIIQLATNHRLPPRRHLCRQDPQGR